MDDITLARALHVLAVVVWIGGVAFVTTVLLPGVRDIKAPKERVVFFEIAERCFAGQARYTTGLTGLSGFYMVARLDLWHRFVSISYWWMHAMVAEAGIHADAVRDRATVPAPLAARSRQRPAGSHLCAGRAGTSHFADTEPADASWRRLGSHGVFLVG